jgi:hypothetical protein
MATIIIPEYIDEHIIYKIDNDNKNKNHMNIKT